MPPPVAMTEGQRYQAMMQPLIPGIVPENENYKDLVGEKIYDFVVAQIGMEAAPKVTGMLIDVPIEEIIEYCSDHEKFKAKVSQAQGLLSTAQ